MAITAANLSSDRRTISYRAGDETADITYRPSVLTPNMLGRIGRADQTGDLQAQRDSMCELVCEIVAAWDVLDADGQPVPLDADHVGDLPLSFLMDLVATCRRDGTVDPGESVTSAAG